MLAYFDCFSGISGDMILGALMDLGVPLKWLKDKIRSIPLEGFDIKNSPAYRSGIRGNLVDVHVDKHQPERNLNLIKNIIENSHLSDIVKSNSVAVFERIAAVEAEIHGCDLRHVHFHELGGVDALVDVIGSALCMEYLDITHIVASKIPLGKGFVSCQHGKLPLPAPATIALLKNAPVYGTEIESELVTPTGAAIITTLARSFEPMPAMIVNKIGYGAGHRDIKTQPNVLRIILGVQIGPESTALDHTDVDWVWMVETCIDDMNPEMFGFLMERLFEEGALDVYWIPVFMKKNRPGTMVQVMCHTEKRDALIRRILSETTSTGVRYYETERRLLSREQFMFKSSFGLIQVKKIVDSGGCTRLVPEYEICKKIARDKNIPLRMVYDTISREVYKKWSASA